MDHKTVEKFILSMPGAKLDYPFGEGVAVYKVINNKQKTINKKSDDNGKMFALIEESKTPVRLSLKCDPELSKVLRAKYETVLEGYHLNKKHWNTIILSGQLTWPEVQELIKHSYNLVAG